MENNVRKLSIIFIQIVIVEKVQEKQQDQTSENNRQNLINVEREFFDFANVVLCQLHQKPSVDFFVVFFTQTLNLLLINYQLVFLTEFE